MIERAVITSTSGKLRFDLPTVENPNSAHSADTTKPFEAATIITDDEMRRRERENIVTALQQTKWKIAGAGGAAELLGLKPTTLSSRIKQMHIERPV